ncbi:hypothetical protein HIM_01653 [Hirsutella minnesotensis 3608]|nr:hypothetical protein HIM_01653 [Hirsutella minnesotensis 3608]
MASPKHTLGPKCRLAPVPRKPNGDGMPAVEPQFFYSSLIPIDDPLSTGSIIGGHDSKSSRRQFRPFSRGDNGALDKAWLSLASDADGRQHQAAKGGRDRMPDVTKAASEALGQVVQTLALKHWEKHHRSQRPSRVATQEQVSTATLPCCSELLADISQELQSKFCGLVRKQLVELSSENVAQEVMVAMQNLRRPNEDTAEIFPGSPKTSSRTPSHSTAKLVASSSAQHPIKATDSGKENEIPIQLVADNQDYQQQKPHVVLQPANGSFRSARSINIKAPARAPGSDDGISGKPFVRVGSADPALPSAPSSMPQAHAIPLVGSPAKDISGEQEPVHAKKRVSEPITSIDPEYSPSNTMDIVVGVSRLHKVSLPMLQMKPIYWSPINDIAVVMRATWFYRDTMVPVAPIVANQLEAGYHELRPWTETWGDEIRCALEIGPLGEEKISHCLWPQDSSLTNQNKDTEPEPSISSDPYCAARCFQGDAAAQGAIETAGEGSTTGKEAPNRPFANYHVIYRDSTHAFLLKPSLKPSAYYGRRPAQKIMKGITVGVPVTRGFDRRAWDRLHDKAQRPNRPGASAGEESHESSGPGVCPACKAEKDRGQVTDLVLVAHGIGQKFAERVESFHFTHAINGFRRAVNIEMASPIVRRVLREGQNGLMILPLNWRMGLSFEDGGPLREEDMAESAPETFALKDIEPSTIPAVRSMMSDVMFDIPFYMSHHKSKMISALVSEANRVYRLWCRNNPGFADKGRVHMIAHSLGSAMALDILSRQPTTVPRIDLTLSEPGTQYFEFDTKNLFLAGSPAGFFLLLERGALMPRRGRRKPGADPDDIATRKVVADAGTFGCLAVDNIYNILAKEDPIAYFLNGAVDPAYAASLKTAYVPSTSTSMFKSLGDAVRHVVPGMAPVPDHLTVPHGRPTTARLPSQLEMEVHDFTREEIAEKKAFLLNDNGQIDWFLRSGGGPLEIQYLNMLSAHSSYWTNQDFIRMLCIEVGRQPGRANTLPAMRAVKATKIFSPTK